MTDDPPASSAGLPSSAGPDPVFAEPGPAVAADPPANPPTPEPPPPATTEPPPPATTEPPPLLPPAQFHFHGDAREYFRIWIVNTLLTLLTLGVFAAWAKVRKRRYLRGNVELLGHRFDYRADPRRILIGNVLVVILFLGYSLFGVVYPFVQVATLAVGILLLPWIIVRSLSFNAHNTTYRGIRFRFHPPLSPAVALYLLKPVLIPLSLGFYYPAWIRERRRYEVGSHRLGDAYFRFDGGSGPFYLTYLFAGAIVFAAIMTAGLISAAIMLDGGIPGLVRLIPIFAIYGLALFIAKHYVHARLFNHVWNHTHLDGHRFRASLDVPRWLGLQLANLGAIIASCGLLYPWAVVRAARRTARSLVFVPAGPIEGIERFNSRKGSAIGDSAAEFIGLDFGL